MGAQRLEKKLLASVLHAASLEAACADALAAASTRFNALYTASMAIVGRADRPADAFTLQMCTASTRAGPSHDADSSASRLSSFASAKKDTASVSRTDVASTAAHVATHHSAGSEAGDTRRSSTRPAPKTASVSHSPTDSPRVSRPAPTGRTPSPGTIG